MLFDRTAEVQGAWRTGSTSNEYGRLGIAKDILDVYAVLRGDPTLLEASDNKSIASLTKEMTDLVARGSEILMGHRVAIAYSRDLVIFGLVTSMNFRFLKFNRGLIPTFGYVDLTLDIHNANNTAGVRSEMGVNQLPSTTTTGSRVSTTGTPATSTPATNTSTGWKIATPNRNLWGAS
jgi:hypothetical protein